MAADIEYDMMLSPSPEETNRLVDDMPLLAGKRVPVPRFMDVNWAPNQTFSAEDNPDRVDVLWEPPAFIQEVDPYSHRYQRALVAEELQLPAGAITSSARVVRGVLSEEQCAMLLSASNDKQFTPALLNLGGGQQALATNIRDGYRAIVDSPEVAAWLFQVLHPFIPARLHDGSRLVELNERLRFLCYTPGQIFHEHLDGAYQRPHGHARQGDVSRVTIHLYLHDIPKTFGGALTFFPSSLEPVYCQPEAGTAVIFTQDLPNEDSPVKQGFKCYLRAEAMYERPSCNNLDALCIQLANKESLHNDNGMTQQAATPADEERQNDNGTTQQVTTPTNEERQSDNGTTQQSAPTVLVGAI